MNHRDGAPTSANLADKKYDRRITGLAKHVLEESAVDFGREGKFTDASLLKLFGIFGVIFERALELYESGRVTRVSVSEPAQSRAEEERNSARWLLEIHGTSGDTYRIFPEINYCRCAAFKFQVLGDRSYITCKHILAAWLATVDSQKLSSKTLTPALYKNLLLYQLSKEAE